MEIRHNHFHQNKKLDRTYFIIYIDVQTHKNLDCVSESLKFWVNTEVDTDYYYVDNL